MLARNEIAAIFGGLLRKVALAPGDRVKTLKGTLRGVILKILDDGRLKWRAETGSEFIALPETLVLDD